MKFLSSNWFPVIIWIIILIVVLSDITPSISAGKSEIPARHFDADNWIAPDERTIPDGKEGALIRYGKDLIVNTSLYFGPKGVIAKISNGMNCQNCHMKAGTILYGNSFAAVASTYPKYRDRSGKMESIVFRINECMERSMNGKAIDSNSHEMQAMVSFLKWIGKDVPKDVKPRGAATEDLPYLDRAADPAAGAIIYKQKCQLCHGSQGNGLPSSDSSYYINPPLWGNNSFNVSAGLYRMSRLAGFIKNNMPLGATYNNPQLTNEQAWDLAAFISSQPRPVKHFSYDWPSIKTKPVDHPFGPYSDSFTEHQHKFGPFGPIKKMKADMQTVSPTAYRPSF